MRVGGLQKSFMGTRVLSEVGELGAPSGDKGQGERLKGKGMVQSFSLCPLTFSLSLRQ